MYIPKHFLATDKEEITSFMQRYSFATLVTINNNRPEATHLPFVIKEAGNELILLSHFAKANPQATSIDNADVLVIFSEPHAYISPKHYEKEANVPTWNYIAVHAYGKAKVIADEDRVTELLQAMIINYESDYLKQWQSLPQDYKSKMIKGIVAFEIEIYDLQAKNKLSQNRSVQERDNIINTLSSSSETTEQDIAAYMAAIKNHSSEPNG